MEVKFLDANVFIRFITQDDPEQSRAARAVFNELRQGILAGTTSEGVIAEIVWVLGSKVLYNLPRLAIQESLKSILSLNALQFPAKQACLRALGYYTATNVSFVDALIVAHMELQGIATIISFDRDFDRFPAINREEPRAKDMR